MRHALGASLLGPAGRPSRQRVRVPEVPPHAAVAAVNPYRTPEEPVEWVPRIGALVVILPSHWSESYGHVGKHGTVQKVEGGWAELKVWGPFGSGPRTLHVGLAEIADAP